MSFEGKPFWAKEARKLEPVCRHCGHEPHLPGLEPGMAIAAAAAFLDVGKAEILSHRREDRLVTARAFAVWSLRGLGVPMHYAKIGRAMGGRDHTTIINLHLKAILLRVEDAGFRLLCDRLENRFYLLRECRHDRIRH